MREEARAINIFIKENKLVTDALNYSFDVAYLALLRDDLKDKLDNCNLQCKKC